MERLGRHVRLTRLRRRFRYRSLALLMGVQAVLIFGIGPLFSLGIVISPTFAAFALLAVIFAVVLATDTVWPMVAVTAALLFNTTAAVLRLSQASRMNLWMDGIASILSIIAVSWVVVGLVFSPGRIDRSRIVGAVVLYLNAAILFEALFRLLAETTPGAFTGITPDGTTTRLIGELMYFSVTTLTTVGYGDIAPVHPIARSLANLEGLVGQLYPAIILARIMTLYRSDD